jgi:predicted DNA repair protein MutK
MAGILGYLAALSDDIASLAGRTMATSARSLTGSFDDMSLMLDDIATYTKVASAKSSGLVIDDLAAISNMTNETTSDILKKELEKSSSMEDLKKNILKLSKEEQKEVEKEIRRIAQETLLQSKRKAAQRELPIVWKIAKGSALNKLIIIPIILIISAFVPWLMAPVLILGGTYLAYEGAESVLEKFFGHHENASVDETISELSVERFEDQKVASAVKTDFILSLEIMVIALSMVTSGDVSVKLGVLLIVGLLATAGVYGVVGLIVKLDDIGFFLQEQSSKVIKKIGDGFVLSVPWILVAIGIIGTIAMLAVGGGIIAHQFGLFHSLDDYLHEHIGGWGALIVLILQMLLGMLVGIIVIKMMPFLETSFNKIKDFILTLKS